MAFTVLPFLAFPKRYSASLRRHAMVLAWLFAATSFFVNQAHAQTDTKSGCDNGSQYTFSWSIHSECDFKPRGGTTKGVETQLDTQAGSAWISLQEQGLSTFERDRRAILAMAGPYRVSFDFLEVVGYTPGYTPSKPYQSWGTEFVYVVEDTPTFISLQHIMVMYFQNEDGSTSEPMVMKHWRQDWHYEKTQQFVYSGNDTWSTRTLPKDAVKGTWSQSVYQVDDSPRYESHGKWQHHANFSTWISAKTWRPLPRREGSVRNDYQVLEGFNRHSIVPNGWVQEEENMKLVIDGDGNPDTSVPYLAKEQGIARYERIVDHNFAPGDDYWQKSGPYWADVRQVWSELVKAHPKMKISKRANGQFMFMPFFQRAQEVADGATYDSAQERKAIRTALSPFIQF